jgi:hypothetical protein
LSRPKYASKLRALEFACERRTQTIYNPQETTCGDKECMKLFCEKRSDEDMDGDEDDDDDDGNEVDEERDNEDEDEEGCYIEKEEEDEDDADDHDDGGVKLVDEGGGKL